MISDHWALTNESTAIELIDPADIPWDDIAFPSTKFVLEKYVEDLRKGSFGVHQGHFEWPQKWEKFLREE